MDTDPGTGTGTGPDRRPAPLHVIIPTIGSTSLPVALASVRRQTVPLHVVLVDDRRTAGPPLVERFSQLGTLPDLTVVVTGGVGLARARNAGLAVVGDDATLLLDDDDNWCPHHAERLLALPTGQRPNALCWSGCRVITWGGVAGTDAVTTAGFGWLDVEEPLWSTNLIPPSSVLVPAGARLQFDPDLSELEDWDAWLQLCERTGGRPAYTGSVTMGYGRNIVAQASLTMSATNKPDRQRAMSSAYEVICAQHPVPRAYHDRRDEVRAFRQDHLDGAGSTEALPFDYYERSVEGLVGPLSPRFCCRFDFAADFEQVPR